MKANRHFVALLQAAVVGFGVWLQACSGCRSTVITRGSSNVDCDGVVCNDNQTCSDYKCVDNDGVGGPNTSTAAVLDRPRCNTLTSNGTCLSGYECEDGVCYVAGTPRAACAAGVNGRCANGAACVAGTCTPITPDTACTTNNKDGLCPGAEVCVEGICFNDEGKVLCSPARLNGYCPSSKTCVEGACQDVPLTCSATTPSGSCGSWEVCVQGSCIGPIPPDACSPTKPNGVCPAQQSCVGGTCTPLSDSNACSVSFPGGLCPADAACKDGDCIALTPGNTCSAEVPTGLCRSGGSCRDGACVAPACENGGVYCPTDKVCSMFSCVPLACDPAHPSGVCVDPNDACDHGACVKPSCSPSKPDGVCPSNQFCLTGVCMQVSCNSSNPSGLCPTGQRCAGGICRLIGCADAADPNGFCSPDTCDLQNNVCQRPLCGMGVPDGRCDPGRLCTPVGASYECRIPPCGPPPNGSQNGSCLVGEQCVIIDSVPQCVDSPCGIANQYADCSSATICCNATRKYDGTPPLDDHTRADCSTIIAQSNCGRALGCAWNSGTSACESSGTMKEQFRCNDDTTYGRCALKNCGPAGAESDPNGFCPSGNTCTVLRSGDTPLDPGARIGDTTCVNIKCSPSFPTAPCGTDPLNCVCVNGVEKAICSATAKTGACPGEGANRFVCINAQCAPACTLANSCGASNAIICTRDADCDGRTDAEEGANDPNNDGVLDEPGSTDSDATAVITQRRDGVPDALDVDSDGDTLLDRVEYAWEVCGANAKQADSDGDGLADGIEARVSAGQSSDPVATPVNSDGDTFTSGACNGREMPDFLDTDSDNDGISDHCESRPAFVACANNTLIDYNGIGAKPAITNTDAAPPLGHTSDDKPDYRDTDADGDGISDKIEGNRWPWLSSTYNDPAMFTDPADHDGNFGTDDYDYRDFDSDNDGVNDLREDVDGDGIVDCQIGTAVNNVAGCASPLDKAAVNTASAPTCAAMSGSTAYPTAPSSYTNSYNPLCACSGGNAKCFLAESSRIHKNTNGGALLDSNQGVFLVCSAENLKPINIFAEVTPDYSFGLEQSYNVIRPLSDTSNNVVGMLMNDNNYEAGTNLSMTGSNGVAGFVLARRPADAAILADNANTDTVAKWVQKAVQQETTDRASWAAATGSLALNLKSSGFTLIVTRSLPSYDGFGNVLSRYRILTNAPFYTSVLRDRLLKVLAPTTVGLPPETQYTTDPVSGAGHPIPNYAQKEGGPQASDFILLVQTLYRFDNADTASTAGNVASKTGRVITIAALTPYGSAVPEEGTFTYRPQCAAHLSGCDARDGCALDGSTCLDRSVYCQTRASANACNTASGGRCIFDTKNNVCKEIVEYQIPLFFADNITNGSAITQYGDGLRSACESFKQRLSRFDFFWSIDDSGSMSTEIAEVKVAAGLFATLVENAETDYRLASISTDMNMGGWEMAWNNDLTVPGINGDLPKQWNADDTVNTGTTNSYTGKILGRCTPASSADRDTDSGCAAAAPNTAAVSYFQGRLPVNVDGSGWEYSLAMPQYSMYHYGSGYNPCAVVNASASGRETACKTQNQCSYDAATNTCRSAMFSCADMNKIVSDSERMAACAALPKCVYNTTAKACYENFCDVAKNAVQCDGVEICNAFNGAASAAMCAKMAGCAVGPNNDCITSNCNDSSKNTQAACNADRNCRWDTVNQYCNDRVNFGCDNFKSGSSSTLCNAHAADGCHYGDVPSSTSDDCISTKCFAAFNNRTMCNNTPGCSWRGSYCDDSSNTFEASPCDVLNQASCTSGAGCTWRVHPNNGQGDCVSTLCSGLNESTCADTPGCQFRDPAGANNSYCDDNTGILQNQYEPIGCEWSPGNQACVPAMSIRCFGLTQTACNNLAPSCVWDAVGGTCDRNLKTPFALCDGDDDAFPGSCAGTGTYTSRRIGAGQCAWNTNAWGSGGHACEPNIKQAFRNDTTVSRVFVAVTDEEDCYLKDANLNGNCGEYGVANAGIEDYLISTEQGAVRAARTESYRRFFAGRNFTVFAITGDKADESLHVGAQNGGCNVNGNSADAGNGVIDVAEATGGAWGSICPAALAPTVESMVLQVLGAASPYKLSGPGQPISSTIKVAVEVCADAANKVDTVNFPNCVDYNADSIPDTKMIVVPRSRENGFDYDASSKTLILYGFARPKTNGDIVASYRYWVDISPITPSNCPCAQASPASNCNCPNDGEVCAVNAADFCAGASASECASRSPVLHNCSFSSGVCAHACRALSSEMACRNHKDPAGKFSYCFWDSALARCEIDYCAERQDMASCAFTAGCTWNTIGGGRCVATGLCAVDPSCGDCPTGGVCDPTTGVCSCEAACDGGCPTGQNCDPTDTSKGICGSCKCPACPSGANKCPQGSTCDSATCGACVCDQTCRSCTSDGCTPTGCSGTYECDSRNNSPSCGICIPKGCGTVADCPFGQACIGHSCVCDTSCGGACPTGSTCDTSPASATCGQCQCDTSCGGVGLACQANCANGLSCINGFCACPQTPTALSCDTNPASPKCGTCRTPVHCTTCPAGQICDLGVGECVVDPSCGGCDSGYVCDPSSGICVPGQCPPLVSATNTSVPPISACTAQNLNCCYGNEGLSPYDNDLDGYMDCNTACGRTIDSCSSDPAFACDHFDNDPTAQ